MKDRNNNELNMASVKSVVNRAKIDEMGKFRNLSDKYAIAEKISDLPARFNIFWEDLPEEAKYTLTGLART